MASLSDLSTVTTATLSVSNLILVTPQKNIGYQAQPDPSVNSSDLSSFIKPILFNYEGEQSAVMQSDITDHWIEDNSTIQDQIALRPEEITTHGFVGELNDIAPAILAPLKAIALRLQTLVAYTPGLSITALEAYNEAAFLYASAAGLGSAAINTWSSINGQDPTAVINGSNQNVAAGQVSQNINQNQTKQQIYFQLFYGYWRSRALFTVQTPWAIFQNMAIKSLRAIQDADTRMISDFEITFKMLRFATTVTNVNGILNSNSDYTGRLKSGASSTILGPSPLTTSPTSFASLIA